MQTNGRSANADEAIGESELNEHSTTFIQSKDVDPSSTGENSQCRYLYLSDALHHARNVVHCYHVCYDLNACV